MAGSDASFGDSGWKLYPGFLRLLAVVGGAVLLAVSACGGERSEAAVEVPAPAPTGPPAAFEWADGVSEMVAAAAVAMAPDPSAAKVAEVAPSYDGDEVVAGVAVLEFPPYSGTIDLPGQRALDANGDRIFQRVERRYTVKGLTSLYVGVDISSGEIDWADVVHAQNEVSSIEVVFESPVDTEGRPIPADARRWQYDD
ncbi:MAG: hypothetical protein KTV68_10275 [Acidimicrobiia bacterium]|nr:hypothetical protein [Acidimicrobiia bacterium]MCY4435652.1 hypothetical protein [bacterium]